MIHDPDQILTDMSHHLVELTERTQGIPPGRHLDMDVTVPAVAGNEGLDRAAVPVFVLQAILGAVVAADPLATFLGWRARRLGNQVQVTLLVGKLPLPTEDDILSLEGGAPMDETTPTTYLVDPDVPRDEQGRMLPPSTYPPPSEGEEDYHGPGA